MQHTGTDSVTSCSELQNVPMNLAGHAARSDAAMI